MKRMVKKVREVLLVALALGFCVSHAAFAQAEKPIPNYQTVHRSMVAVKSALEGQLGEANLSFGYIPGFGSIFVCEFEGNLEKIDEEARESIRSLSPLIEIENEENVCVVIRYGGELIKEEYVIVVPKMSIADVERWKIFSSETETSTQPIQTIENITSEKAYSLIQSYREGCPCRREDFVIIDVRTPEEYADGHIENAINLDYYSKAFEDELNKLDRNKIYLIYCRSARRSGMALDTMKELGFTKVYNMLGGIIQWKAEGFPTIK
jgi:rhodanese-related sulfurtransferase